MSSGKRNSGQGPAAEGALPVHRRRFTRRRCAVLVVLGGLGLASGGLWRQGGLELLEEGYYTVRQQWEAQRGHPEEPLPNQPFEVGVAIDPGRDRHPISPEIYGMALAPPSYVKDLRLGSNRWGGNQTSRYNWVHGNATNAARDWRWANRPAVAGIPARPSSAVDQFVKHNRAGGAASLLTIPTLGWVARDADLNRTSRSVPERGGAPLGDWEGAIAGYDPSANRRRTSVPSFARRSTGSGSPPRASDAVYQDEWVRYLVRTFGSAEQGGVRYYAMDNEPDLWASTHTDVQPAQPGYEELLSRFLEYASAVRAIDPTAQITGPVSSGWTGYLFSPLDQGRDNYRSHPERNRQGGEPFLLWFLKRVREHDLRRGRRTLDVLDVHYYPQAEGVFSAKADPATQALRLRSTRSLWDPSYLDESWIRRPVRLLPRLREWIAAGYPGTRLGITEWNFGGEEDISGALAIAETLGLFGREEVALANYWAYPPAGSPGYLAFKLFRNTDGQGRGFGDVSCRAESTDARRVSCFAATEAGSDVLTFCLLNKTAARATVPVTVHCTAAETPECHVWRLSAARGGALVKEPVPPGLRFTLPPYSITLVRVPRSR